jgi:drug/metabolite transporter (DMT)-like permease
MISCLSAPKFEHSATSDWREAQVFSKVRQRRLDQIQINDKWRWLEWHICIGRCSCFGPNGRSVCISTAKTGFLMAETNKKKTVQGISRETMGLLLGFIGVVIFGATLPATRAAVVDLAPWFVTTGRAAVAGLIALGVLLVLRRKRPARALRRDILIVSFCVCFGFPGLIGLAMQTVPASHGGVVLGILPLGTAICGALFAGERPSTAYWICGIIGALLVVAFALRESDMTLTIGDIYLFLSVIAASVGYVFSGKLSRDMPGWEVISWALIIALPLTIPLALWLVPADPFAVRSSAWIGFAYAALMSMYLGFFPWNAGLAMGGVARVSQVQLLQTFVTLIVSALFLGEKIDAATLIFAVAVVGVVLIGRLTGIKRAN